MSFYSEKEIQYQEKPLTLISVDPTDGSMKRALTY